MVITFTVPINDFVSRINAIDSLDDKMNDFLRIRERKLSRIFPDQHHPELFRRDMLIERGFMARTIEYEE
jgi:hypothetical protein